MVADSQRCLLISTFTIKSLAGFLRNDRTWPYLSVDVLDWEEVGSSHPDSDAAAEKADVAVVWTEPERVVPSFRGILAGERVNPGQLLEEVDAFVSRLRRVQGLARTVLIPSWVLPAHHRGLGMLDLMDPSGIAHSLNRMNLRLVDALQGAGSTHVLDANRWVATLGQQAFSQKLWYLAKVPFANALFQLAVGEIKAAIRGVAGKARKLVIVDLDDTMWGGIVGDVGWKSLRLGGHDHIGEAFVDFQRALKAATGRGVLLGIVSKNDESVALEAIQSHPEMQLSLSDFAGWRINWNDKAQNIIDLVADLNLGLDSVVFLDDNPVERGRVREALPEVAVPDWPQDKLMYAATFLGLDLFDKPSISQEDTQRTAMYVADRERKAVQREVGSPEEWLESLGVQLQIRPLDEADLPRAVQLLNRTNQMNLTTRRVTEDELRAWMEDSGRALWTARVRDRFGDSGLTGVVSLEAEGETARIVDFVVSCRVFGRNLEHALLYTAFEHARELGVTGVEARYIRTSKNKPTLTFLENSALTRGSDDVFARSTSEPLLPPAHVQIV